MLYKANKGFTLVELLVVISILGILAAALTTQVTKARSMGQAIRCKANLKTLAQATMNFAVDNDGRMPKAGSYEHREPKRQPNGRFATTYFDWKGKGWVGWTGDGRWPSLDIQSPGMKRSCYFGDTAFESITNGVLWSYAGKDLAVYMCDVHKSVAKKYVSFKNKAMGVEAGRSYVMNGYFGFSEVASPTPTRMPSQREVFLSDLSKKGNAGNLLLFAELPVFAGSSHGEKVEKGLFSAGADSVLETFIGTLDQNGRESDTNPYHNPATEEYIGFNHQVAKRYVAHVAFADGHVDVLIEPKGAKDSDLKDVTKQLCNGVEITQSLQALMR